MASVKKLFEQANAAHQQGNYPAAIEGYRALLKKKPNHGDGNYLLGTLLAMQGETKQALLHLTRAATLLPDSPMVKTNLGLVQKMLGQLDEAEKSFRSALRLQSNQPEALNNLAALLLNKGQPVAAEGLARKCMALGGEQEQYAAIQCANALADQGRTDEAISLLAGILKSRVNNQPAWHNYLSFLPYSERFKAKDIYQAHCQWAETIEQVMPAAKPSSNAPIKVGYLSPDWYHHPVGLLMTPLIHHHDKSCFTTYLYHDGTRNDQVTQQLRESASQWRDVAGMSDQALHAMIAEDGIDILVDLTGHLAHNRLSLFAQRAAPVQVSYLGYCATTGLTNMDYAISDQFFDPTGEEDAYSESLVSLPRISFAYQLPEAVVDVQTSDEPFTFGSFNTLRKISPQQLACWASILQQSPDSRLIMQARGLAEEAMRKQVEAPFVEKGIPLARLEFHDFSDYQTHLSLVSRCDITLDPGPWNGHMTSLNTLAIGIPMLTQQGDRRSARMGAAILQQIGMEAFIAKHPQEYVQKAVEYSQQRTELKAIGQTLRQRIAESPLVDGEGLARAIEEAYLSMMQ